MALFRTGDTDYGRVMESKSRQYEALICRAETQRRDCGNQPSKQEAVYYRDAAKVCEEIRDMNLSQRAEYSKWNSRVDDCLEKVEMIVRALNPDYGKPKPAAPAANNPISSMTPPTVSASAAAPSGKSGAPAAAAANQSADGRKGTPVTTASGFTTYNATKDVPADVIEGWYKSQPGHDFEDVTGMEDAKNRLMEMIDNLGWQKTKELVDYKEQQCIFFYGLPGTGKTFVIEAFVSELMKKGYKFIQLSGGDIHASLVGVAEKTVKIAFQEAIDNAPCVIFIDEFDNVCINRNGPNAVSHEKRLTVSFLEAFNSLSKSDKPVVLLGATNYPNLVDNAMMDRIVPVLVPLPDEASRVAYFERKFKNVILDDELTFAYMGEVTDNYSYRDLGKVTSFIKSQLIKTAAEENTVYGDNGEIDQAKSDEAASEAIRLGNIRLTMELFESIRSGYAPSDKTANLESLKEFENRLAKAAEGN